MLEVGAVETTHATILMLTSRARFQKNAGKYVALYFLLSHNLINDKNHDTKACARRCEFISRGH